MRDKSLRLIKSFFLLTALAVSAASLSACAATKTAKAVKPQDRGPCEQKVSGQSYTVRGKRYHVLASADCYQESGSATWYGSKFHGRKTSSGERYDQNDLTAAHKTLPFGTLVEVINPANNKKVVVRINDRGPFGHGAIIDISKAAAQKIGMLETIPVHIRTVGNL